MHSDVSGRSGRTSATVAVLITAALWGTTGFGASFAAPLSAVTTGAAAMGIGGTVLAAVYWRRLSSVFRAPGTVPLVEVGAAAIGHALFGWSLAALSASTVTLYTLLEPAVATVLAVWILGERLTAGGWAGLSLVLLGLVVLSVNWRGRAGSAT